MQNNRVGQVARSQPRSHSDRFSSAAAKFREPPPRLDRLRESSWQEALRSELDPVRGALVLLREEHLQTLRALRQQDALLHQILDQVCPNSVAIANTARP